MSYIHTASRRQVRIGILSHNVEFNSCFWSLISPNSPTIQNETRWTPWHTIRLSPRKRPRQQIRVKQQASISWGSNPFLMVGHGHQVRTRELITGTKSPKKMSRNRNGIFLWRSIIFLGPMTIFCMILQEQSFDKTIWFELNHVHHKGISI